MGNKGCYVLNPFFFPLQVLLGRISAVEKGLFCMLGCYRFNPLQNNRFWILPNDNFELDENGRKW